MIRPDVEAIEGLLLVDKPEGFTSHDVVAKVRGALKQRRVGHLGTLDPLATGLLVLTLGRATRLAPYLDLEPKIYQASALFGISTDTQDTTGTSISTTDASFVDETGIRSFTAHMTGCMLQVPPMYSAVKVDGVRLYRKARAGTEVERQSRPIFVKRFELTRFVPGSESTASFVIECGGGTYVRTLIHDLGRHLGCGAAMSALRRTSIGPFSIDRATSIDEVQRETCLNSPSFISIERAVDHLPRLELDGQQQRDILHGRSLSVDHPPVEDPVAAFSATGLLIAICRVEDGALRPRLVFDRPDSPFPGSEVVDDSV